MDAPTDMCYAPIEPKIQRLTAISSNVSVVVSEVLSNAKNTNGQVIIDMEQRQVPHHIVAVAGLVRNGQNQILLLHSPRGDWEFPGGQVEEGETLTQALQREILEETGVTASTGALVGVYSNIIRRPPLVMFGFLCEWVAGEPKTSTESLAVEWVERDAVLSRIRRPAIRDRMKDMLEFDGRVIYRAYIADPHQIQAEYTVFEERFI